jgi:hypothetical protein
MSHVEQHIETWERRVPVNDGLCLLAQKKGNPSYSVQKLIQQPLLLFTKTDLRYTRPPLGRHSRPLHTAPTIRSSNVLTIVKEQT